MNFRKNKKKNWPESQLSIYRFNQNFSLTTDNSTVSNVKVSAYGLT